MVHLIPRKEGDGLRFELPSSTRSEPEMEQIAKAIKKNSKKPLIFKEPEPTAEDILKSKKKLVDAEFSEAAAQQIKKESIENPLPEEKTTNLSTPEEVEADNRAKKIEDEKVGKRGKRIIDVEDEAKEKNGKKQKKDEEKKSHPDDIDLDAISRVLNGR
jgi:hypothetical protein